MMRSALRSALRPMLPMVTSHSRSIRTIAARMGLGLALGLVGCSGDTVKPYEPVTDPAQFYFALALNYGAVNLSLTPGYKTFQLTATPLNGLSEPMVGLPTPTFRSTDTTRVQVSPSGLLTALNTGTGIKVIAELTTSDNVKHVDTAFVNVNATTDPPPTLATLTIDPVAPDSAIWASPPSFQSLVLFVWSTATFPAAPTLTKYLKELDAGGTAIPSLQTEYFSLDSAVASVNRRTGAVKQFTPGPVRMIARTVAYGVVKADTTVFTNTPPIFQLVTIGPSTIDKFTTAVIRQSGVVYWANAWRPIDVVFDDPAAASIPSAAICTVATTTAFIKVPTACDADFTVPLDTTLGGNSYRIRQFMTPGTYTYRDTLSGAMGKVVVWDSTAWGR